MQTLGTIPEAEPCVNRIPRDNTTVPLPPLYPEVSANSLISTLKEPMDNWGDTVKTHICKNSQ